MHLLSIVLYDICTAAETIDIDDYATYPGFFPGTSGAYLKECIHGSGQIASSLDDYNYLFQAMDEAESSYDANIGNVNTTTDEIDQLIATL